MLVSNKHSLTTRRWYSPADVLTKTKRMTPSGLRTTLVTRPMGQCPRGKFGVTTKTTSSIAKFFLSKSHFRRSVMVGRYSWSHRRQKWVDMNCIASQCFREYNSSSLMMSSSEFWDPWRSKNDSVWEVPEYEGPRWHEWVDVHLIRTRLESQNRIVILPWAAEIPRWLLTPPLLITPNFPNLRQNGEPMEVKSATLLVLVSCYLVWSFRHEVLFFKTLDPLLNFHVASNNLGSVVTVNYRRTTSAGWKRCEGDQERR